MKGAKACVSSTSGTIWPYKLITGLLSKITKTYGNVINVQALTPVTEVITAKPTSDRATTVHTISTPRGSVQASKVIYATNAYTAGLLPEYAANIIPSKGLCCHLTTPKKAPFLPYSYLIYAEDGSGKSYLIPRPDGSIIVGGAMLTYAADREKWFNVIDDSTLIEPTKHYYDGFMQRTFRGWEDSGTAVREMWTGSRHDPGKTLEN